MKNKRIIESKVKEIVGTFMCSEENKIFLDENLKNLGFDSFKTVELIIALEDHFDVTFEDSDLDITKLETVNDVINMVKRYK